MPAPLAATAACRRAARPLAGRYHEESLLSVGGEAVVTHWDVAPSSGSMSIRGRARCSPALAAGFACLSVDRAALKPPSGGAAAEEGGGGGGCSGGAQGMGDDGEEAGSDGGGGGGEDGDGDGAVLLVGGVGARVDCFVTPSSRAFALRLL